MYCWKSISLKKEYGSNRLNTISFLIGLLAFLILYVPISMIHGASYANDSGMFLFIIALITLPTVHSLMHILPLILLKKSAKLIYQRKNKILPVFTYYTNEHLTKKVSLIVALAPTLFITIPGIVASYLSPEFHVYLLLFTSVHIGITFVDFLYVQLIMKAPKRSYIENGNDGFDILLESNNKDLL